MESHFTQSCRLRTGIGPVIMEAHSSFCQVGACHPEWRAWAGLAWIILGGLALTSLGSW
jgi:hypothetical protein